MDKFDRIKFKTPKGSTIYVCGWAITAVTDYTYPEDDWDEQMAGKMTCRIYMNSGNDIHIIDMSADEVIAKIDAHYGQQEAVDF